MTRVAMICRSAGVVIALLGMTGAGVAQQRTILTGARVVQPDGTLASGMAVVLSGGRIERVVPEDQASPAAKDVVIGFGDRAGAVISPGLIDLCSSAGEFRDNVERVQAIDPSLSAIDALNPADPFLERALRAGITSVMITPAPANVVAGAAATVRTWAPAAHADVLRSDGPILFVLGQSALNPDRDPTSRAGALTLLRESLTAARSGKGDERLSAVVSGKLDALVACDAPEDVDAAARTFGEYSVKPNLVLGEDALEAADDLGGTGVVCVVGPLTFNSPLKSLRGPSKLAGAGLEVAFSGDTPSVEAVSVRVTASLAVRYGMDPAAARRALTRNAARVAGVAERVGTLEPGRGGDIVVFSGDPLRLDATVLAVFVGGEEVYAPSSGKDELSWGGAGGGGASRGSLNDLKGGSQHVSNP